MLSPLLRRVARLLVLVCVMVSSAGPEMTPALPGAADPADATAAAEVRLRKLHLVRPDLIPYPIAFEVCC